MRRVLTVFLIGLPLMAALAVRAQSPFSVSPLVQVSNGATLLRVAFAIPTNHYLYADKLSLELSGGAPIGGFQMPEPLVIEDKFSGKQKRVFGMPFEASVSLPSAAAATGDLTLTVRFQGCDEANCFFPEEQSFTISSSGKIARVDPQAETSPAVTSKEWRALADDFTVAARGSGYLDEKAFLAFLDKSQSDQTVADGTRTASGGWGILLTIGLIILGGVGLNLTPCILPMIPINLAIIGAGAQAGSRRRGFALGATYAAGMAIAYGALGLAVVLTGSKFGTINSSPWFNLVIALVFLVLALGMFDVLAIDLSRFQRGAAGNGPSNRSKFIVAYTMGTVAALLAGACVAPVVISVLLQATTLYNAGIAAGLLLPFLLGVGMGMPWPFAGAGLSFLPKPGRWMTRVKYGFGVLIALFAVYYGHLSLGLFRSEATIVASASARSGADNSADLIGEQLAQALDKARADGRPVFIDFWASWCKNCSAMEHTTFQAPAVRQRLEKFHEVRLQTERLNESSAKDVLDYFNVLGLPSYVVLTPKLSGTTPIPKDSITAAVAR